MISVEAMVSEGRVAGEAFLEVGEEDLGIHAGGGILQALQHRPEGIVGSVTELLAVLQELVHRGSGMERSLSFSLSLSMRVNLERSLSLSMHFLFFSF